MSDKLSAKWSKRDKSLLFNFPRSCDGALLYQVFSDRLIFSLEKHLKGVNPPYDIENLLNELDQRGYDITTLKFEIKLKKV